MDSLAEILRRLDQLNVIGVSLSSERNLDHLLETILLAAKAITRADACTLYRMNEASTALRFAIVRNDSLDLKLGGRASDALDAHLDDLPLYRHDADDTGTRLAYAWQVVLPGQRTALLDYFAVRCDLRGGGVGTQALQLVKAYDAMWVHDLLLECEHPAEAPDPAVARRRIGFYLRAGARATALESRVFGTRYAVLSLPCGGTVPDAALCKELRALYKTMIPQPYYRGNVIFYGN